MEETLVDRCPSCGLGNIVQFADGSWSCHTRGCKLNTLHVIRTAQSPEDVAKSIKKLLDAGVSKQKHS